jgi:hypothetical protein
MVRLKISTKETFQGMLPIKTEPCSSSNSQFLPDIQILKSGLKNFPQPEFFNLKNANFKQNNPFFGLKIPQILADNPA